MEEIVYKKAISVMSILSIFFLLVTSANADRDRNIYELAKQLVELSNHMAQSSYDHYKGWGSEISDQEQAILFEAESFAAACRLFLRLTEERFNYYRTGYLRTNLYNAFMNLIRAYKDLDEESDRVRRVPYSLDDCQRLLDRMEYEFSLWPSADNLAYLHQKYVTLERMEEVEMIDLTFEGRLVIEMGDRPNRPVYLIKDGKKCGLSSPSVLQRYGGWDRVLEVPAEVINSYPVGEDIKDLEYNLVCTHPKRYFDPSNSIAVHYSYRRESTGLAVAARMICQLTVERDTTSTAVPVKTKVHQSMPIR
jgi:hypothetical protein